MKITSKSTTCAKKWSVLCMWLLAGNTFARSLSYTASKINKTVCLCRFLFKALRYAIIWPNYIVEKRFSEKRMVTNQPVNGRTSTDSLHPFANIIHISSTSYRNTPHTYQQRKCCGSIYRSHHNKRVMRVQHITSIHHVN